jgi:hypothetical protein
MNRCPFAWVAISLALVPARGVHSAGCGEGGPEFKTPGMVGQRVSANGIKIREWALLAREMVSVLDDSEASRLDPALVSALIPLVTEAQELGPYHFGPKRRIEGAIEERLRNAPGFSGLSEDTISELKHVLLRSYLYQNDSELRVKTALYMHLGERVRNSPKLKGFVQQLSTVELELRALDRQQEFLKGLQAAELSSFSSLRELRQLLHASRQAVAQGKDSTRPIPDELASTWIELARRYHAATPADGRSIMTDGMHKAAREFDRLRERHAAFFEEVDQDGLNELRNGWMRGTTRGLIIQVLSGVFGKDLQADEAVRKQDRTADRLNDALLFFEQGIIPN